MALAIGIVGSTRVVHRKRLAWHEILLYTSVAILVLICFRMNARQAGSLSATTADIVSP